MLRVFFILFVHAPIGLFGLGLSGTQPTQNYTTMKVLLPDKYVLYWELNDTHITFETHVTTTGWVGVGVSKNGDMTPGDVAIGWVKDGEPHFHDRHATEHSEPAVDRYQSWRLVLGNEEDGVTILKSVRNLEACDEDDISITNDLSHVIWAFSDDEPDGDTGLVYHMANRGTTQIYFLDPPNDKLDQTDDLKIFDITSIKFPVPAATTTYQHTYIIVPPLGPKQHVVRYEPAIQKENTDLVHHAILYVCDSPYAEPNMTSKNMMTTPAECYTLFASWATGGSAVNLPANVGQEFGSADTTYFILETHYNNPRHDKGRIDSSGLRMIYTSNLREHESGMMHVGSEVYTTFLIPPHEPAFKTYGACSPKCTQGLGNTTMNVFSVGLHAHLLARGMTVHIERDGQELQPLGEDENYDYNFQQLRMLRKIRTVKAGDRIVTECIYDSRERTRPTLGGAGIYEEMCIGFLWYYPKSVLSKCGSVPTYNFSSRMRSEGVNEMISDYNWSDPQVRKSFDELKDSSDQIYHCYLYGKETIGEMPPIRFENPYVPPAPHLCTDFDIYKGSAGTSAPSYSTYVFVMLVLVLRW